MLTTAASTLSATRANDCDKSAGEGVLSSLASSWKGLAARTPRDTKVPIRIPIPRVTAITTAGSKPRLVIPARPLPQRSRAAANLFLRFLRLYTDLAGRQRAARE